MCIRDRIGAKIVVSSDAHAPFQVGVFDKALAVLEKIDFPENLIMNLNRERLSLIHIFQTGSCP